MASLFKSMEQLSKYTPGRSSTTYKPMYLRDENGYVKGAPHLLSKLYKDIGLLPTALRMEIEETKHPLHETGEWNEEWYGPAGTKIAMQAAKGKAKGTGGVDSLEVPLLDLSDEELERQTAYFRELNEQRRLNLMQEEEERSKRSSTGEGPNLLDLAEPSTPYVSFEDQEAATTSHGAHVETETATRPAEDPQGLLSVDQGENALGLLSAGTEENAASFATAGEAAQGLLDVGGALPEGRSWGEAGPGYEPLLDLRQEPEDSGENLSDVNGSSDASEPLGMNRPGSMEDLLSNQSSVSSSGPPEQSLVSSTELPSPLAVPLLGAVGFDSVPVEADLLGKDIPATNGLNTPALQGPGSGLDDLFGDLSLQGKSS
mmetsp:Transcript_21641/g.33868  ORF Transcript_21641/g.33868 Transcript_21641/m.33868 type:complete len:373 (-) Transcript_21641:2290-3408(-)